MRDILQEKRIIQFIFSTNELYIYFVAISLHLRAIGRLGGV